MTAILKNSPHAKVSLVARTIQEPIKTLAAQNQNVTLFERNFKLWDLWNKDLLILAANNRSLHETIRKFARTRRVLINVADTPDLCDFYLGSVVTKGNLKMKINKLHFSFLSTLTNSCPCDFLLVVASNRSTQRYPCCSRSRRMHAHATSGSRKLLDRSSTRSLFSSC